MASLRLVEFLKLPYRKKRIFLTALVLLWILRIGLWALPYSSLRKLVSGIRTKPEKGEFALDEVIWSVEAAGKYVVNSTCLIKALAAKALLARNGYPSTLRIGVDNCEGFVAHAWIEHKGIVILGGPVNQYRPLYVLE